MEHITNEIINAANSGVEVIVLVGGGNILRGKTAEYWNIDRAEADNMGMLATIINSIMLRGAITSKGIEKVRVIIKDNKDKPNFGNARFIRNLFEKSIILHATNTKDKKSKKVLRTLTDKDINIDNILV